MAEELVENQKKTPASKTKTPSEKPETAQTTPQNDLSITPLVIPTGSAAPTSDTQKASDNKEPQAAPAHALSMTDTIDYDEDEDDMEIDLGDIDEEQELESQDQEKQTTEEQPAPEDKTDTKEPPKSENPPQPTPSVYNKNTEQEATKDPEPKPNPTPKTTPAPPRPKTPQPNPQASTVAQKTAPVPEVKSENPPKKKFKFNKKNVGIIAAVNLIAIAVISYSLVGQDTLQGQLELNEPSTTSEPQLSANLDQLSKVIQLKQEPESVWPPQAAEFFSFEVQDGAAKFATSNDLGEFIALKADFDLQVQADKLLLTENSSSDNTTITKWCYQLPNTPEQCTENSPNNSDFSTLALPPEATNITLTVSDQYGRYDSQTKQITSTSQETSEIPQPPSEKPETPQKSALNLSKAIQTNILAAEQEPNDNQTVLVADSGSTVYFMANCQPASAAIEITIYPDLQSLQANFAGKSQTFDLRPNPPKCNGQQPQALQEQQLSEASEQENSLETTEPEEPEPLSTPACADNLDNDQDGLIDFDDPGCSSPSDNNEQNGIIRKSNDTDSTDLAPTPAELSCSDNIDNDNDGYLDQEDPACINGGNENDPDPVIQVIAADEIYENATNLQGEQPLQTAPCLTKIRRKIQFADFKDDANQDEFVQASSQNVNYSNTIKDIAVDVATTAYKDQENKTKFILDGYVVDGFRYFFGNRTISSEEAYKLVDVAVLACTQPAQPAEPFPVPEVPEDHWSLPHVYNLAAQQIISTENLELTSDMHRAQFLELLVKTQQLTIKACEPDEKIADDLTAQHPSCDSIKTALTYGILQIQEDSRGAQRVYPDYLLSRSDAVILIHNYLAAANDS